MSAIRKMNRLKVTRQVLNGSGMMQLMNARTDTFYYMLDDVYRKRCDDQFASWAAKIRVEAATWNGKSKMQMGACKNERGRWRND